MVGKNKAFDNDKKSKMIEALKSMKARDLQKFFDKYEKGLAIVYRKETRTEKQIVLCELIVQNKEFKNTEQFKKATKYLAKHRKAKK